LRTSWGQGSYQTAGGGETALYLAQLLDDSRETANSGARRCHALVVENRLAGYTLETAALRDAIIGRESKVIPDDVQRASSLK